MLAFFLRVLVTAVAVVISARIVPGLRVKSFGGAFVFALVLGLLNSLLFSLLTIITLPLVILSFGLFLLVINAFLFWLADKIVSGVEVRSFGSAFLGSLVTSILTSIAYWLLPG